MYEYLSMYNIFKTNPIYETSTYLFSFFFSTFCPFPEVFSQRNTYFINSVDNFHIVVFVSWFSLTTYNWIPSKNIYLHHSLLTRVFCILFSYMLLFLEHYMHLIFLKIICTWFSKRPPSFQYGWVLVDLNHPDIYAKYSRNSKTVNHSTSVTLK